MKLMEIAFKSRYLNVGANGSDSKTGSVKYNTGEAVQLSPVLLYRQVMPLQLIDVRETDRSGIYHFDGLDFSKGPFVIYAMDKSGQKAGKIIDWITS